MNAYELADELEDVDAYRYREIAANMLRQQADRIAELEKQTKPLSDEEICNLWLENSYGLPLCNIAFEYARAIEERHGIK